MKKISLYPTAQVFPGQSFKGVKVVTLPDQSLSLKQILDRFVRRQPLPQFHDEGFYQEGYGDLEKMAKEDLTIQHERIARLKDGLKRSAKKHIAEEAERKKVESASVAAPPNGGVTGSGIDAQAPPSAQPAPAG